MLPPTQGPTKAQSLLLNLVQGISEFYHCAKQYLKKPQKLGVNPLAAFKLDLVKEYNLQVL